MDTLDLGPHEVGHHADGGGIIEEKAKDRSTWTAQRPNKCGVAGHENQRAELEFWTAICGHWTTSRLASTRRV